MKENGRKRRANHEWFKERKWLHFDTKTDSIFCFICQKELKKQTILANRIEPSFVLKGFKDWHNAMSSFKKHENSAMHLQATERRFENRSTKHIGDLISHGDLKPSQKEDNWKSLLKVFSCIRKLGRQGIALRSNPEKDSNFKQILLLLAEDDQNFTEWIEKRTDKYIGHVVQNEILELFAHTILREVIAKIRKSNFYAILLDETRDVANKEQMVFGLRWIEWLEISYEIHEDFIGLYECKNTTGEHLTFAAEDILLMNDLKLINCRGQNYDGAGSMQGKNSGVKSRILQKENRALSVWCYAHNTNLSACESLKKCKLMKNALSTGLEIVKSVKWSPKR